MDWHNFVTSDDAQGVAKWLGVGVSFVLAFLGLERWYTARKQRAMEKACKEKAALDARFAYKADLAEVEACHERIRRHKEANERQTDIFKEAVAELKQSNEYHLRIEEKLFDTMRANDNLATSRHIHLLNILASEGFNVNPEKPTSEGN